MQVKSFGSRRVTWTEVGQGGDRYRTGIDGLASSAQHIGASPTAERGEFTGGEKEEAPV